MIKLFALVNGETLVAEVENYRDLNNFIINAYKQSNENMKNE